MRRPRVPKGYDGAVFTLKAAARILGLAAGTVKEYLSDYPERFSPPMYGRGSRHPRLHRMLTADDLRALRGMRVKRKIRLPRPGLSYP